MTRASLFALVALIVAPVVTLGASEADADVHVRFGGRARIHIRTPDISVNWGTRRYYYPPYRPYVGGHVWVGGGYYYRTWAPPPPPPPPPPASCDCAPGGTVPAYYYPVAPAPVVAAPAPRPQLARIGIGAFVGGAEIDDQHSGDEAGLLLRLRLTPGWHLEGELAGSEHGDSDRVDHRLGASMIYEFGAQNNWAPYVLAGLGVNEIQNDDGIVQTTQSYAELGAGLRWALTPRFHLAADVRGGAAESVEKSSATLEGAAARVVPPPSTTNEKETFTKARLSAMFYF